MNSISTPSPALWKGFLPLIKFEIQLHWSVSVYWTELYLNVSKSQMYFIWITTNNAHRLQRTLWQLEGWSFLYYISTSNLISTVSKEESSAWASESIKTSLRCATKYLHFILLNIIDICPLSYIHSPIMTKWKHVFRNVCIY